MANIHTESGIGDSGAYGWIAEYGQNSSTCFDLKETSTTQLKRTEKARVKEQPPQKESGLGDSDLFAPCRLPGLFSIFPLYSLLGK